MLGTDSKQGIDRKLQRYGVVFESSGRGKNLTYEIKKITDYFKLYAITKLGITANADFKKIRNLYYYLFCCDGFAALPYVEMEQIMTEEGAPISRQTIKKWIAYLKDINYIMFDTSDCYYYAINKRYDNRKIYREISRDLYLQGWAKYWATDRTNGTNWAYAEMRCIVGGHPYKKPKICHNAIYLKKIQELIDVINESFLDEITIFKSAC
uniref:Uncharacterized protein n=1 Tax=uncultured Bacillota bacterium TaxID=344338 RepID=A0A650EMU2_9FIRM|nr:hypothetical protein Firmicute1046_0490 [uncultured Firmicutes bacterium]